jgi:hypothetical protein
MITGVSFRTDDAGRPRRGRKYRRSVAKAPVFHRAAAIMAEQAAVFKTPAVHE